MCIFEGAKPPEFPRGDGTDLHNTEIVRASGGLGEYGLSR